MAKGKSNVKKAKKEKPMSKAKEIVKVAEKMMKGVSK